jgi:hypothetical protein
LVDQELFWEQLKKLLWKSDSVSNAWRYFHIFLKIIVISKGSPFLLLYLLFYFWNRTVALSFMLLILHLQQCRTMMIKHFRIQHRKFNN